MPFMLRLTGTDDTLILWSGGPDVLRITTANPQYPHAGALVIGAGLTGGSLHVRESVEDIKRMLSAAVAPPERAPGTVTIDAATATTVRKMLLGLARVLARRPTDTPDAVEITDEIDAALSVSGDATWADTSAALALFAARFGGAP